MQGRETVVVIAAVKDSPFLIPVDQVVGSVGIQKNLFVRAAL